MADQLHDGEFWLPSEFLVDEASMEEKKSAGGVEDSSSVCLPCDWKYGFDSFGSALSSPVESVVGSTETESDEEDYMAGLTRQMAHTMLEDAEKTNVPTFGNDNTKTRVLAGSPQSTLCAVSCWSGRNLGSNRGSLNGPSQVSLPASEPFDGKDSGWDLLYRPAAGQVARMKPNDGGPKFQNRGFLDPTTKQTMPPSSATVSKSPPSVGSFYPNQALTQQQLQNARFQELKQQQLLKQQCSAAWGRQGKAMQAVQQPMQNRARTAGFGNVRYGRPLSLSPSAWPPLHQPQQQQQQRQVSSGMRAVFLGNPVSKRESCGTGVFLPRRAGCPAESRKKPACSTVLLPARVVQALNLNLDEMGTAQPRFQVGCLYDHEYIAVPRSNNSNSNNHISQQKRNSSSIRHQPLTHLENLLPQEWTY